MSCNNSSGICAFGNSWWWIIVLVIIFVLWNGNGNSCGCALCSQAQRRRQSGCDCDDGSETRVPLVETAVRTVAESADAAMCNPCCPEYADLAEQNILGMLDTLTNAQEALDRKLDQLRQWQNTDYGCS